MYDVQHGELLRIYYFVFASALKIRTIV